MKIVFAGFDLMAPALEALARDNKLMRLFTCRVDGVYETNDRVIALAKERNVPYTLDRITKDDIDRLLGDGCELLISAGYYYLIPVDDRLPMVNIHPSLLPYGRGAWPMPLAILDGLTESGVTVHKTERSFDTGDILLQERFTLADDETLKSFMDKVNARLPMMMHRLTADFDTLWQNATPQGEGEYQQQPDPEQYVLTPKDTVKYADRVLRAFFGFPCFYRNGEDPIELIKMRAYPDGEGYPLIDGVIR